MRGTLALAYFGAIYACGVKSGVNTIITSTLRARSFLGRLSWNDMK